MYWVISNLDTAYANKVLIPNILRYLALSQSPLVIAEPSASKYFKG